MTIINRDSFQPANDEHFNGTVEVTLHGRTRRVRANLNTKYGWLTAYDMVGRYQTGGKVWAASVTQHSNGTEHANFGRDDRSGRFRKENNLWFRD